MIQDLLSSEVQLFIQKHEQDDPGKILLKYKSICGLPTRLVVNQIIGRKKSKEKLPHWYSHTNILYPPALNIEQASSERASRHKVKMLTNEWMSDLSDETFLDLTAGFGVDNYFFSQIFKSVDCVDPNVELLDITKHNHTQLGAFNIKYHNTTADEYLQSLRRTEHFDLVYIDPSRRSKTDQKVFSLEQCEPNVVQLQEKIWDFTERLIIKASPLLDIDRGLSELSHVKKVVVLSVYNECKELLFYCEKFFKGEPVIEAINLGEKEFSFSFLGSEERKAIVPVSDPKEFLYEPNAAILKSGGFKTIAATFNLFKLHPNTHLYTSHDHIENFPGRIFRIRAEVKMDSKALASHFPSGQASMVTRNYPLSVETLRKKTHLKDGSDNFLIGCTGVNKKFLLVASVLQHF